MCSSSLHVQRYGRSVLLRFILRLLVALLNLHREDGVTDRSSHVQLLEDRVHVACGPGILESNKPTLTAANHRWLVLRGGVCVW